MDRKSQLKKERRESREAGEEKSAASGRRLKPQNLAIVLGLAIFAGAFFYFFAQRPSNLLTLDEILRNVSHVHALSIASSTSSSPSRLILGTHDGMFISEDEGKSWRPAPGFMGQEDVMQLAGSPDGSSFYAGGHSIAVMASKDGGSSWVPARGNLPGTDVHNLAAYPGNHSIAYAFVVGAGLSRTRDGGRMWDLMNRMQGQGIGALVISQASPDTLYATTGEGIQVSTDGGRAWQPFRNELMGRRPFYLIEVAGSPGVLLAGKGWVRLR
ncbi:MAG: hypothetical protein HYU38_04835 [Candidatus Tectomicrobia bacterium]|nr:hypothetical protein [Candidatus Tectomicrobia bacterium]